MASISTDTNGNRRLQFTDQNGNSRNISDYRGKVVFLNFWASWCVPCVDEMPGIQRLFSKLKDDDDFAFIILNIKEDYETGVKWAKGMGYTLPLSNSNKTSRSKLRTVSGRKYYVRNIPDTFILNKKGVVVAFYGSQHADFDLYFDHMLDLAGKSRKKASAKKINSLDGIEISLTAEERSSERQFVRLSVTPKDSFKLAAKPGVRVTTDIESDTKWFSKFPMTRHQTHGNFKNPPEFRIGFSTGNSGVAEVTIDYAYCKTDGQCYVREATVNLVSN